MNVSCKLWLLGVCAALSVSRLSAGEMPVVPTIMADGAVASAEPMVVVFTTPAAPGSTLTNLIRFDISSVGAEPPPVAVSPPKAPPLANTGASRADADAPADERNAVAATSADSTPGPAISFSAPRYEPVKSAPAATGARRHEFSRFEREALAACLVLEAASQGEFGMRAVMAVIRNRAHARPERFVRTVLQPKQFSALNRVTAGVESLASAIRKAKRDRVWNSALAIVDEAVHDNWHDPTGGATHYTRAAERTHWTSRLAKTTTIGAHSFYR